MGETYDYIICGGGTVGCVLASRLSHSGHSVLVVEAGPEDYNKEIMSPVAAPHLHGTRFEYNMMTSNQPGLGNRCIPNYGGKLLSGSSGINYGLWTRGHSVDYDSWAKLAGDDRWNYANMLKYFKVTQSHHDPDGSPEKYGFGGPISTTAEACTYPLRKTIRQAMLDAGLEYNPDTNGGNPFGFGPFTENWKNGQRQPASKAYDLSKAAILTDTVVARVDFDDSKTAVGITLTDGTRYMATKEVLVTCGALKTPQLLMLSGIGPQSRLAQHNIPTIVDLPVGENYHDKISTTFFWKLKNPEKGYALGSPAFNRPEFRNGNPIEWLATISTPHEELVKAAQVDGLDARDPCLQEPRGNVEMMIAYAPIAGGGSEFRVPFDGNHISSPVVLLLPTSRGNITLASTDPMADPILNPAYLSTEMDRATMRAGMRLALQVMETDAAREVVEGETPPPGHEPLTSACTDSDLDRRMQIVGSSFFQNGGTAAMGSVVDTQCRVKGVQNLRVCDASVLPVPLAGHYQAPMYAFGEAVAQMLLE
ncbi:alcohol oxidase [Penicillium macrosclerotiorum]|uniref:alcohol oxidase n=1 Tax=Penicillium macrosclerotiorum TaxID=303699 RepID=UPI00254770E9|nr:alcohol oxidase [Penicillium macrosclerotiorum]KAJ5662725.1 alcohol oxidase [Penicillium macrosclerotiorum]